MGCCVSSRLLAPPLRGLGNVAPRSGGAAPLLDALFKFELAFEVTARRVPELFGWELCEAGTVGRFTEAEMLCACSYLEDVNPHTPQWTETFVACT